MGPDGAAVNAAGGALNSVAAGAVEKGITPDQQTAPATPTQGTPTAADASVEQAVNKPMRKGGNKKKGKKGMMKYKAGGAKPDYLDMDKDGNKTESMKSAIKDRRKRGGKR